MKRILILFLLLISMAVFSQKDDEKEEKAAGQAFYKTYKLNLDLTDVIGETADKLKEGEIYFKVTKNADGKIENIGYYDHTENPREYLLDRYYNIYFNNITYEYKNELLSTKKMRDKTDFILSQIDFEYNDDKKIKKTILWIYSIVRRELVKTIETKYTYKDKEYDVVDRLNKREQTFERIHYNGSKSIQKYERYDIDGKTLQYIINFTYEGEQLVKKQYFSKSNVVIKTEHFKVDKDRKEKKPEDS